MGVTTEYDEHTAADDSYSDWVNEIVDKILNETRAASDADSDEVTGEDQLRAVTDIASGVIYNVLAEPEDNMQVLGAVGAVASHLLQGVFDLRRQHQERMRPQ